MAAKKKMLKKETPKKKTAKKKAKGRAPARKPAAGLEPKPVKTGSGPTPVEVAQAFVALLRAGKPHVVEEQWLAPGVESVEGVGASMAWTGKKAVLAKYRAWEADHEIHDMQIEGPWVGATGFALRYRIDVTQKSTGQRSSMEEIAVYSVRGGKVVREEFHFRVGG